MFRVLVMSLILSVMALLCVGLVTIYSTTCDSQGATVFLQQLKWIGIGVTASVVIAMIPLEWQVRCSHWILGAVCCALLYLFIGVLVDRFLGEEAVQVLPFLKAETKGSFRWMRILGYQIQPSEFAKFALLLCLSSYYGTHSRKAVNNFWRGCVIPSLIGGLTIGLIMLGKDLSSSIVTAAMVGGIMFCAGVKFRHLLILLVLGCFCIAAMIIPSAERRSRITSFQNAEKERHGDGYQLFMSQMALGRGGLSGCGYSLSIMKRGYLPERHTDFILAIWGEEMGFWGILFVLSCYFILMMSLMGLAWLSPDRVGMLICMGLGVLITSQSITNIGVISGWGPTTGLTAPFVSYGGSSVLSLLMCIGLVLNVCRRENRMLLEREAAGAGFPTMAEMRESLLAQGEEDSEEEEGMSLPSLKEIRQSMTMPEGGTEEKDS